MPRCDLPVARAAYPFRIAHAIRYGDIDAQRHVNHVAYASYFEYVRMEFLHHVDAGLRPPEVTRAMVRLEVDYRAELFFPGTVELGFGLIDVGTTSARFGAAVFAGDAESDGVCAATGLSVVVQLDAATRRPTPWSAAQRAILAAWTIAI